MVLFQGNKTMEAMFPTEFGIRGSNINALFHNDEELWIGSKGYDIGRGVTKLNTRTFQTDHFDFDVTVNMNLTEIHSFYDFDNVLWVGGNSVILVFDKSKIIGEHLVRKEVFQILILPLWLEIQILYGLALTMGLGKLI